MSTTTETAPECCPFCGAGKKRHLPHIGFRWFACGTMTAPEKTPRRDQTPACADAERERLTRERDEARAERDDSREAFGNMKRSYEEAVDANINALNQIGDLCMENANLLARVKRLEEAGDAIVDHNIGCGCGQDGPCRACRMASDGWKKAKEATP